MAADADGFRCLACGEQLDDPTPVFGPDKKPERGDIAVCAYCHTAMVFLDGSHVRFATIEDIKKCLGPEVGTVDPRRRSFGQSGLGRVQ